MNPVTYEKISFQGKTIPVIVFRSQFHIFAKLMYKKLHPEIKMESLISAVQNE